MTTEAKLTDSSFLEPELLSTKELKENLKARFSRLGLVDSLSRENLITLYRETIFPLPQRSYRANRRGKMLTARRLKSGLEETGNTGVKTEKRTKSEESESRLRFPVRTLDTSGEKTSDEDKIERRKSNNENHEKNHSLSSGKIPLKRTSETKATPESGGKKQRVAITWP